MSEWAYRECSDCGKRVHVNHTCAEWNRTICKGDPWGEIRQIECELVMLEQDRDKYLLWVEQKNERIQKLVKRLPKDHEKAKLLKNS